MQRSRPLPLVVFAALMLVAAGCGSSSSSTTSAAQSNGARSATTATTATSSTTETERPPSESAAAEPTFFSLSSPAFQAGKPISATERAIATRYSCDGSNTSPSLRWNEIPSGTRELVLTIFDLNVRSKRRFFDWVVAGLKPTLRSLSAGALPPSAIVGRNGFGQNRYSVCPPRHTLHSYAVILYAVRNPLHVRRGFDANRYYNKLGGGGLSQGQTGFAYRRR
jgi:hypothetical protein